MVEEFERQRHVLERRHGGHEMEGLEDDADIGGTQAGETVLVKPGIVGALHRHASFRGAFEPGDDHEQGRFAGAGGTYHGDGVAWRHAEVNATQDGDGAGARRERHMHGFELDCRGATLFQDLFHGRGD